MTTALIQDLTHGLMADFSDTDHPSKVYGLSEGGLKIEEHGTLYGFVMRGSVRAEYRNGLETNHQSIHRLQYFSIPHQGIHLSAFGQGFCVNRIGYHGFGNIGGPIEQQGRLKYIDGCSDSLLIGPPVKGDPCMNLLDFPEGIDQTMHTHPTIRAGLIHSGRGICNTDEGPMQLERGKMFILYPDAPHAFSTVGTDGMTLTVFHPDTDTGPWHDDHPMLNRTIVDGVSAAGLDDIRTKEIVRHG
jgi:quercetin dioxygenase-like cupin family protein